VTSGTLSIPRLHLGWFGGLSLGCLAVDSTASTTVRDSVSAMELRSLELDDVAAAGRGVSTPVVILK
jgi:hypothetical protein